MLQKPDLSLFLPDEDATARLGQVFAPLLQKGNAVLLNGPIGAGKSHFARSVIQARLGRLEDVPSPTFTLIQTYDADRLDIWHADLYRLSHPDEVWELGLDEAFSTAICLVEWAERLGPHHPKGATIITFEEKDGGRQALIWLGALLAYAERIKDAMHEA